MKKLFIFALLLLLIISCNESITKSMYIYNYESFVNKLSKDYTRYSDEDWEKAEIDFYRFSDTEFEKYKDDLTESEKIRIKNLTGKYYAIIAKHKVSEFNSEINSVINTVNGFLEELKK